ncbi:MAG: ATP-binding protein [Bdellovibrionales bacterium]|nr:ATP-binding protein [Bdellovibrionales bacterium]
MFKSAIACEGSCSGHVTKIPTQFIVITGGPGVGKTAFLEYIRKISCRHTAIIPEAASILFSGGFWRLSSETAKMAVQRAIYHVQNEMQSLVIDEKYYSWGVCDRGTLDGLAYWPRCEDDFFSQLNTSLKKEYSKYTGVIHLRSPLKFTYYNHDNPVRIESANQASIIDRRIAELWRDHPNYFEVQGKNNFFKKLNDAKLILDSLMRSKNSEVIYE